MTVFAITQIFFVVGLPLVGVWAVASSIFLCHQYQTIVNGTANGGKRVPWTGDTFVGDQETWSQIGMAMVFFTIGGIMAMVMRSFL